MEGVIAQLLHDYETGKMNRRQLIRTRRSTELREFSRRRP
jgi:hypothetical protein